MWRGDTSGEIPVKLDDNVEASQNIVKRFANYVPLLCNHRFYRKLGNEVPVKIKLVKIIKTSLINYHFMQCERCGINFTWHVDPLTGVVTKTDKLIRR